MSSTPNSVCILKFKYIDIHVVVTKKTKKANHAETKKA